VAQLIVGGLAAGSSYALLAIGLVLVLKTTSVPNFAMGAMGLLPAFIIWWLLTSHGFPYGAAVLVGIASAGLLGAIIERFAMRPLVGRSHFVTVLMTIGVSYVLVSAVSLLFGFEPYVLPFPLPGSFVVAGTVFTYEQIVAVVVGLVITFALVRFFQSSWGVRMRAVAEDPVTARLLGVKVGVVSGIAWALACVVATVAVFLSATATVLNNQSGDNLLLNGFVAATVGGFSSVPGALLGGLALGVLEDLVAGYISSAAATALSLVVIMVVLLVRPTGVLGSRAVREV